MQGVSSTLEQPMAPVLGQLGGRSEISACSCVLTSTLNDEMIPTVIYEPQDDRVESLPAALRPPGPAATSVDSFRTGYGLPSRAYAKIGLHPTRETPTVGGGTSSQRNPRRHRFKSGGTNRTRQVAGSLRFVLMGFMGARIRHYYAQYPVFA